jgi:hypothetical protein
MLRRGIGHDMGFLELGLRTGGVKGRDLDDMLRGLQERQLST